MAKRDRNENDRLKSRLRQWGADEASREADQAPASQHLPKLERAAGHLLHWAALAAGVILTAGTIAFWTANAGQLRRFVTGRAPAAPPAPPAPASSQSWRPEYSPEGVAQAPRELERTRTDLVKARQELEASRQSLSAATQESARLQGELDRLRQAATGPANPAAMAQRAAEATSRAASAEKESQLARARIGELDKAQADVSKRLATAQADLDAARQRLAQLEGDPAAAIRQHEQARKDLEAKLTAVTAERDSAAAQAKKAEAASQDLQKRLDQSDQKAQATLQDVQKRLAAAVSELDRVNRGSSEAVQAQRQLTSEMDALRARQITLMNDFQRAYLSLADERLRRPAAGGAAPSVAASDAILGLASRQAAARRGQLIERLAKVHAALADTGSDALLDRIEVLLTQLELVDTRKPAAAQAFADLVRQANPIAPIDEMLFSGRTAPAVRQWLLEARSVLAGAFHVG